MPITLKRVVPIVGVALAMTVSAYAQIGERPQPQQPGPPGAQEPAAPTAQQEKPAMIARGELTSIDAEAKELTIKPAEGAEQKFKYSDDTKVTGGQGGVAGLATLSGSEVVVHFNMEGADRVATEIEVQAGEPAASPAERPEGLPAPGGRPGDDRPGPPDQPEPGPER